MNLNVHLTNNAPLPKHAKEGDAGLDLTARETVIIQPHETYLMPTGVAVELPFGYVGLLCPRSGIAIKRGLNLANCVGIIDAGYRDEIKAGLHNITDMPIIVNRNERICQLVIVKFESIVCNEVEVLSETERGKTGFGSSGTL